MCCRPLAWVSMAEAADLESVMMSAVGMLHYLTNSKAMVIAASSAWRIEGRSLSRSEIALSPWTTPAHADVFWTLPSV